MSCNEPLKFYNVYLNICVSFIENKTVHIDVDLVRGVYDVTVDV